MNLFQLLFPAPCIVCNQLRGIVCPDCQPDFAVRLRLYPEPTLPIYVASQDTDNLVARLLFAWKYRRIRAAGEILQQIWYEAFLQLPEFAGEDICVPVPLHWLKRYQRGFNQAELLTKFVVLAQLAHCQSLLKRNQFTHSQVGKNKAEREQNVANVFRINPKLMTDSQQSRIILVDDIVTSGSTLLSCQRVLRQAGFHHIVALVLHRGTH